MTAPKNQVPVFALGPDSSWNDLENAMAGSANHQLSSSGKILPLMFFAPLTEPENPDAWLPMKAVPDNLLVVSIERKVDVIVGTALQQAAAASASSTAGKVATVVVDFNLPLADVYRQMTVMGICTHALTFAGKDDASFFFVRGPAGVRAFDKALRAATSERANPSV